VCKSTLARILADRLQARRVFNPKNNPFLADCYKEKPGSAFRARMYFLIERALPPSFPYVPTCCRV
jgi:deoxyadenosine/deoxycytidine kinase